MVEYRESSIVSTEAENHLEAVYQAAGAYDITSKIAVLNSKLGGTVNFYAGDDNVTGEMMLACLQLEYLELEGFIVATA